MAWLSGKFKNILTWCVKQYKNQKIRKVAAFFVLILGGFGYIQRANLPIIYSYVLEAVFPNHALYKKIEKINTKLNIAYVEEFLGKPAIVKQWDQKKVLFERIYIHEKYFIQIIVNKEASIEAYSVTTRDAGFNPRLPLEIDTWDEKEGFVQYLADVRIGKSSYSQNLPLPEKWVTDASSKYAYYAEAHYFGNPGLYKYYIVATMPSGCCISEEAESLIYGTAFKAMDNNERSSKISIEQLRATALPNTFAVIDSFKDEIMESVLRGGPGPDYFDIREWK